MHATYSFLKALEMSLVQFILIIPCRKPENNFKDFVLGGQMLILAYFSSWFD